MAEKKYLDYEGLSDVAQHVNTRLKTVDAMPSSAANGAVRLYVGADTQSYKKGHIYQYQTNAWVDISAVSDEGVFEVVYDETESTLNKTPNEIQQAIAQGKSVVCLFPATMGFYRLNLVFELSGGYVWCGLVTDSVDGDYEVTTVKAYDRSDNTWASVSYSQFYQDFDHPTLPIYSTWPTSSDFQNLSAAGITAFLYTGINVLSQTPQRITGHIYRYDGSSWVDAEDDSYYSLKDVPQVNGTILQGNQSGRELDLPNLSDFDIDEIRTELDVDEAKEFFICFAEFNGEVWAFKESSSSYAPYHSADGIHFTQFTNVQGVSDNIVYALEYKQNLYSISNTNILFKSSSDGNSTQIVDFGGSRRDRNKLFIFNGKLYVNANAKLYVSSDGNSFTMVDSLSTKNINSCTVYGNKIVCVISESGQPLYCSYDSVSFFQVVDTDISYALTDLCEYKGYLYGINISGDIYRSKELENFEFVYSMNVSTVSCHLTVYENHLYGFVWSSNPKPCETTDGVNFTSVNGKFYVRSTSSKLYFGSVDSVTSYLVNFPLKFLASKVDYDNTSSGLSATNAQDALDELKTEISQISNGVIPKGTIAFANLPSLADVEIGWMYNISDDFTTTSDFIHSGISEKAGSNVYCANIGTEQSPIKKWDVFAVAPSVVIDQIYDSTSTNPQSGTAVEEAIELKPNVFIGTKAAWNAFSLAQKTQYQLVDFTDDADPAYTVVDTVQDGNMQAVTSNAVYNAVSVINDKIPASASTSNKLATAEDVPHFSQTVLYDQDNIRIIDWRYGVVGYIMIDLNEGHAAFPSFSQNPLTLPYDTLPTFSNWITGVGFETGKRFRIWYDTTLQVLAMNAEDGLDSTVKDVVRISYMI